eukprot:5905412-Amphidinium_carterae.1
MGSLLVPSPGRQHHGLAEIWVAEGCLSANDVPITNIPSDNGLGFQAGVARLISGVLHVNGMATF